MPRALPGFLCRRWRMRPAPAVAGAWFEGVRLLLRLQDLGR